MRNTAHEKLKEKGARSITIDDASKTEMECPYYRIYRIGETESNYFRGTTNPIQKDYWKDLEKHVVISVHLCPRKSYIKEAGVSI